MLCNYGSVSEPYPGYDWYVDSSKAPGGNGLSSATAFSTLAAVGAVVQAGDAIGLAKGSHFDDTLDLSALTGCTVSTYGAGAAPVIDCSQAIANVSFSKTAGRTNVYQAAVTIESDASKTWVSAWENDTRLVRVADVATCDATPGSYVPSADNTDNITLYIHPAGSGNPITNGKTYEYSKRQYGLLTGTNGVVSGIITRRNLNNNGSLSVGVGATVTNCEANEGQFHNVYVQPLAILDGVICRGAYRPDLAHAYFVFNANNGGGNPVTFRNCQALADSYDSLATGFFGHYNTSGAFGTITFENCRVENMIVGFAVSAGHATFLQFTDCETVNVQDPFDPNCPFEISGGSVRRTAAQGAVRIVIGTENGLIDELTACIGTVSGGLIWTTGATTLTVRNCTFVIVNGSGVQVGVYSTVSTPTITLINNVWSNFVSTYGFLSTPTLVSDNNCFTPATTDMYWNSIKYNDVAAWVAATGQDTHSATSGCDTSPAGCS